MPETDEKDQQVLQYISQLQQQEQELYSSLDNAELTPEQKQISINKINELSQMRINLYNNIKDLLDIYQQNSANTSDTLGQQVIAIKIMEDQLDKSKELLNKIDDEKATKIRLAQINTYYGKSYGAQSQLMKVIILFCIPILFLAILRSWSLLPSLLFNFLVGVVLILAVIVVGYQSLDIVSRDNMNFDEYDWSFNPNSAPTETKTTTGTNPWPEFNMTCIGAECCTNGTTYDENIKKCVSTTEEGFQTIENYARLPIKDISFATKIIPKKANILF